MAPSWQMRIPRWRWSDDGDRTKTFRCPAAWGPPGRPEPGTLMAAAVLIAAAALAGSGLWIWQALRGPDGEGVAVPDYVEQDLLPVNQWSRPGTTLERIDGVVIHYCGQSRHHRPGQPQLLCLPGLGGRGDLCPPATSLWGWRAR